MKKDIQNLKDEIGQADASGMPGTTALIYEDEKDQNINTTFAGVKAKLADWENYANGAVNHAIQIDYKMYEKYYTLLKGDRLKYFRDTYRYVGVYGKGGIDITQPEQFNTATVMYTTHLFDQYTLNPTFILEQTKFSGDKIISVISIKGYGHRKSTDYK